MRGLILAGLPLLGTGLAVLLLGGGLPAALFAVFGGLLAVLIAVGPLPARRRRPEAPVESQRALESRLIEGVAEPMLVVEDGRVSLANQAARALLGRHIEGEDARLALRQPAAAERLANPAADGEAVELVGLSGPDARWLMRVRRIDARRALVHLVDVSARHAIERMRTDFVANASHELRTPLSSVLGFVETLLDPDVGGDQMTRERFLRVIEGESKRMERLVTDLMSLSRIEADRHRAPDAAVDLGALVAEQCRVIAAAGNPRAADLDCPAPQPDLPPVSGDKAQLSQILHNLVGNAMSYGRPGTPIEVRLGSRGNQVVLSVRDHGEGIAADHLPRLTERFYRVDPGRSRAAGGTGLGLAIVKHIVERHRGRLSIESEPGVGTTVTVLLPKHVMKA